MTTNEKNGEGAKVERHVIPARFVMSYEQSARAFAGCSHKVGQEFAVEVVTAADHDAAIAAKDAKYAKAYDEVVRLTELAEQQAERAERAEAELAGIREEDEKLTQLYSDAVTRAERAEAELVIANKKNASSLANNLCPDHRDKQSGKPCLACKIEQLESANTQLAAECEGLIRLLCTSKSALTWYQTQVHNAYETKMMANRGVQLLIDDAIDARNGGDVAGKAIKEINAALSAAGGRG